MTTENEPRNFSTTNNQLLADSIYNDERAAGGRSAG